MSEAHFMALAVQWNIYLMVGCLLEWANLFIHHDSSHASCIIILYA